MIWPNNLRVENFAFLDLRGDPYGQKSTLGETPYFDPNGSQNRPWGVPTVIWPNNFRIENFAFFDLRGTLTVKNRPWVRPLFFVPQWVPK